jgi:hypothetical protein
VSEILEALQEAAESLLVLLCLALGVVGLLVKGRSRNGNERWVEQERRLENEEDTRDQGPI